MRRGVVWGVGEGKAGKLVEGRGERVGGGGGEMRTWREE